jgi:hypothetical protein
MKLRRDWVTTDDADTVHGLVGDDTRRQMHLLARVMAATPG